MAEQVINLPLSGEEIVIAVCDRLAQSLRRDCRLQTTKAYETFRAEVSVKIFANDIGSYSEIEADVTVGASADEVADVDGVEGGFAMEEKPPNEVRVESGQGVPVLTLDEEGRPDIKRIKYSRNRAKE